MTYILAQYTIRSKQDYIFRSNRVAEIMGASENISRSWDILFDQAVKAGKRIRRADGQKSFDMGETAEAFDTQALHMVELFRGGGNDTVLFDSPESFYEVNRVFSRHLLKKYPGMIPMAAGVPYTGNYQKDYAKLMKESDREKNSMVPGQSSFILPFSMMDRNTFQPYSRVISYKDGPLRLTEESYSKRKRGKELGREDPDVRLLDHMVTRKGEESLLAVVHADGNNMGSKISRMLKGITDYGICVTRMRHFTQDTAQAFTVEGLQAMYDCRERLRDTYRNVYRDSAFLFRKVIADGDDLTFICNARFAMEYVRAYLKSVQNYHVRNGSEWEYSSCAGICIFHSHYPFARAYSMAEQACDNAKRKVHDRATAESDQSSGNGGFPEEGWADFHYIHNGIGGNLDSVRKQQGTAEHMARPWLIAGGRAGDGSRFDSLTELNRILLEYKVSRSDIKAVGGECESGISFGKHELIRIYGHHGGLKKEVEAKFPDRDRLMRMWYDLAEIYDLWFKEGR